MAFEEVLEDDIFSNIRNTLIFWKILSGNENDQILFIFSSLSLSFLFLGIPFLLHCFSPSPYIDLYWLNYLCS